MAADLVSGNGVAINCGSTPISIDCAAPVATRQPETVEPTNKLTTEEVQTRLARIEQLLNSDPGAARSEAMELLEAVPGQLMATLYLGIAYRLLRKPGEAVAVLRPLCDRMPNMPMPHLQLGLAAREAGDDGQAEQAKRRENQYIFGKGHQDR